MDEYNIMTFDLMNMYTRVYNTIIKLRLLKKPKNC